MPSCRPCCATPVTGRATTRRTPVPARWSASRSSLSSTTPGTCWSRTSTRSCASARPASAPASSAGADRQGPPAGVPPGNALRELQGPPGATLNVRRRRRLVLAFALIAIAVVGLDQTSKLWALGALIEGERTPVLGDLLGVSLIRNPGAALGIATGMTWIFTVAAVTVTIVVLRAANRLGSRGWTVALGLLLGGAVGNLIDRLIREPGVGRGHVVDFIAYGDWFVGNVADIAIVSSACLMVLLGIVGIGLDGRRDGAAPDGDANQDALLADQAAADQALADQALDDEAAAEPVDEAAAEPADEAAAEPSEAAGQR